MSQRSSAPARTFAVVALAGGFLVLLFVVSGSLGGDDEPSGGGSSGGAARSAGTGNGQIRAAYVVQNGDTLTSIARKTGVPVARIQALNPGVDPQILISGEKLKLR